LAPKIYRQLSTPPRLTEARSDPEIGFRDLQIFSIVSARCFRGNDNSISMPLFKAVSRIVLRRSHFPNRQPRRHNSNPTRPKSGVDPANHGDGTSIPVPNTVATLPIWHRLGPLSKGFQAYGRNQRKRPYTTQFISSLFIYFLGDLSAQNINGDEYDPARTLRALIISAGSSIPSYKWSVVLLLHHGIG
jgi:hypothetical protein